MTCPWNKYCDGCVLPLSDDVANFPVAKAQFTVMWSDASRFDGTLFKVRWDVAGVVLHCVAFALSKCPHPLLPFVIIFSSSSSHVSNVHFRCQPNRTQTPTTRHESAALGSNVAVSAAASACSLTDCMHLFSKQETLDAENKWYCNVCKDFVQVTLDDWWSKVVVVVAYIAGVEWSGVK